MSCPGFFVCKTSVGISDKSSLRSNITFFIYDLPGYFEEVFFWPKSVIRKKLVLCIFANLRHLCAVYRNLKIHSLHSRDFSRELGGWAFLHLRKLFYALMTQKCYLQKYRLETYSILTVSWFLGRRLRHEIKYDIFRQDQTAEPYLYGYRPLIPPSSLLFYGRMLAGMGYCIFWERPEGTGQPGRILHGNQ